MISNSVASAESGFVSPAPAQGKSSPIFVLLTKASFSVLGGSKVAMEEKSYVTKLK